MTKNIATLAPFFLNIFFLETYRKPHVHWTAHLFVTTIKSNCFLVLLSSRKKGGLEGKRGSQKVSVIIGHINDDDDYRLSKWGNVLINGKDCDWGVCPSLYVVCVRYDNDDFLVREWIERNAVMMILRARPHTSNFRCFEKLVKTRY